MRFIAAIFFVVLTGISPALAQHMRLTAETDTFRDYTIVNDSLKLAAPFELIVPYLNGDAAYRIIEQEFTGVTLTSEQLAGLGDPSNRLIATTGTPFAEIVNPGTLRKQQVASLRLNIARQNPQSPEEFILARRIVVRVYKDDSPVQAVAPGQTGDRQTAEFSHPLAEGQWYRIPINRNRIYRIDNAYLQNLGINPATIDGRNLQLWGTDGYELPMLNSAQRPQFSQIPILFIGADESNPGASDYFLFYGNSVNREFYDLSTGRYNHRTHPYSTENYVFLRVGPEPGERMSSWSGAAPSRNITTFRDFIWKEDELEKAEPQIKSGTQWLGQRFTPEFQTQTILRDTLPGFVQGSAVDLRATMVARSTSLSSYRFFRGGQEVGQMNMGSIGGLNDATGRAAVSNTLSRTLSNVNLSGDIIELTATYNSTASGSRGWVDHIQIIAERRLRPKNGFLKVFTSGQGSAGEVASYILEGFTQLPVAMDVTDPANPVRITVGGSGSSYSFSYHTAPGRQIAVQSSFTQPRAGEQVINQNLHGVSHFPDYIIVTSDLFLDYAYELAEYREQNDGLSYVVATQEQIFNEFSGGVPDVAAIRDFVKMLYDRGGTNPERIPRYLLLFGNTTYDYKGIERDAPNTNYVFTYQSEESYDRVSSFGSDDFFGLLDNNEGVWSRNTSQERVDIGIGRITAANTGDARIIIDKIKRYEDPATFGDWRTVFSIAADDDVNSSSNDRDLHVLNADVTAERIDFDASGVRLNKIYQFSYPLEITSAGRRFPQASQAFVDAFNNGSLVINYSGHGSEQILSAERLFQSSDIPRLTNRDRPTIFVTVTCSFGRFDDVSDQSGAEKTLFWPNGGSVASFTTTRVVYTSANQEIDNFGMNIQLTLQMTTRDSDGLPKRLGEIYQNVKNTTPGASFNGRKFILLGDPAMRIGLPRNRMNVTSINGSELLEEQTIQVRALDQVNIEGYVLNDDGSVNSSYTGEATVRVFDASRFEELPDLAWRQTSNCFTEGCGWRVQTDLLFSGRVSVENGRYTSRFIVPKDISYSDSTGRIQVYGKSDMGDAIGSFSNFVINGTNPDAVNNRTGPDIFVYLNDPTFMNGGIVNNSPVLNVELEDESGINTTGAGVGHELIGILRSESLPGGERISVLNDFYISDLDDFTRGRIEYPFDRLPDGDYSLKVRAWDVFNNVGESEIHFTVQNQDVLAIRNVYNYPNPMNNFTRFAFEHNQPGEPLDIFIRVYTLSGRPVAHIRDNRISDGNLEMIEWNGYDNDNNRLAAGTYLYHLRVRTDGINGRQTEEKIERLVIIR
jgi:hypothetical protein